MDQYSAIVMDTALDGPCFGQGGMEEGQLQRSRMYFCEYQFCHKVKSIETTTSRVTAHIQQAFVYLFPSI